MDTIQTNKGGEEYMANPIEAKHEVPKGVKAEIVKPVGSLGAEIKPVVEKPIVGPKPVVEVQVAEVKPAPAAQEQAPVK